MSQLIPVLLIIMAFIAVLGPLVALHEWGHYIVARLCGVKVLTYSIGFGPKIASWKSKKTGIDYRISALPLGGYVKMLDEREGKVAEEEKHLAFNNQHPLKKIAIVIAGPIMNFIIAIVLFWVLFLIPNEQLNTRLGSILPNTPAAEVSLPIGDKVVAVDGHDVKTWEEINYRLADRMGETGTVTLSMLNVSDNEGGSVDKSSLKENSLNKSKKTDPVTGSVTTSQITETQSTEANGKTLQPGQTADLSEIDQEPSKNISALTGVSHFNIPIKDYMQGDQAGKDTITSLGIMPWQPHIEPVIGELTPDGAAMRQGMQVGDQIVAINGEAVNDWLTVATTIRDNPETLLAFDVLRKTDQGAFKKITLNIMPQGINARAGQQIGQIGARAQDFEIPDDYKTMVSYDPIEAVGKAFSKTGQLASMTLSSMGKMITGKVGLENLSGPITIAVISKQSFEISWEQVLSTAALISLSLAVLNLLPIPVLDGGHLLYYIVELIRGKPVSERVQIIGFNIGFLFLIGFMVLAISNDFSRYILS